MEVDHSDAALMGMGLEIDATSDGSVVEGSPGLHDLAFLDARGTALVEVGWFEPLEEVAVSALAEPGLDPNLVAWLLCAVDEGDKDLDTLDVALAEALEQPTVWGVLTGIRVVTRTDLPVADDVLWAAATVWQEEPDHQLRRLLVTHAVLCGWEPSVVGEWLESFGGPVSAPEPQEVLASIGLGRVTSSPLSHGGREVALAGMWLATRAESAAAAEWEHAVGTARARLMCALSSAPVAIDVAWLLAEALLE